MSKGGDDNKARAKELADSIRDRNQPPSIDAMNRIYDVVLNMNSLNSKPSGMEDFMDQMKKEKKALVDLHEREDFDMMQYQVEPEMCRAAYLFIFNVLEVGTWRRKPMMLIWAHASAKTMVMMMIIARRSKD